VRTLDDWLRAQQQVHLRSIDLGLERVGVVAAAMGLLPVPYPTVLVGGTNGKGSVVAWLTEFAAAAGLTTCSFTSPHLRRYTERIQCDRKPVDAARLIRAFERIEAARGGTTLTFFEYNTLAALDIFAAARPDLAIIEVGLGGRLDATNLIDADVAVLVSVGLDHCEWLGDTVEAIGQEKAGIFRRNQPVVLGTADMPSSVRRAIETLDADARWPESSYSFDLDRSGAPGHWSWVGRRWRFDSLPPPALAGRIQRSNAATALAALEALAETRLPALEQRLNANVAAQALGAAVLQGRFQIVAGEPTWILDVAHNPAAARLLARELRDRSNNGATIAVCAMLADKDVEGIVAALEPVVDRWILAGIDDARGLSATDLRARLPGVLPVTSICPDVPAACETARRLARPADRIVVFGSFHTVGPALDWLRL